MPNTLIAAAAEYDIDILERPGIPAWAESMRRRCPRRELLGAARQPSVQGVMVALDRASHQRAKQREEESMDVLDVREVHRVAIPWVDDELPVAGEEPVSSHVAMSDQALLRNDLGQLGLTFGDGLPGIASVIGTVLPPRRSPAIDGSDGFHSGYRSKSTSTPNHLARGVDPERRAVHGHDVGQPIRAPAAAQSVPRRAMGCELCSRN